MVNDDNFLGKGWSFPPEFSKNEPGVKIVEGETDIKQSLHILLNTAMGERVMRPKYGCSLREFLFTSIDNSKTAFLKDLIANAILKFEARINVDEINIDSQNYLEGLITIEISYIIKTTNSRANIVFPFYLIEGTLVDM